ncbi:hypothetical protein SUGI_0700870 [Cryptomeria japonica]|nr:hypothetical protein SUGI_0700870 [Cryptomeria japonica]
MKELITAVLVPAPAPFPISTEVSNFYQGETTSYNDLLGNGRVEQMRTDKKNVVYPKMEDDFGAAPPVITHEEGHSPGVGH